MKPLSDKQNDSRNTVEKKDSIQSVNVGKHIQLPIQMRGGK